MIGIGWRRAGLIVACYGAAAFAWFLFSTRLGPSLVASGYDAAEATAWGRLVTFYASGLARDATLAKWEMVRPAVVAALAIHALLLFTVIQWTRNAEPSTTSPEGWCGRAATIAVLLASFVLLVLTALFGSIQDYTLFRDIWREVLRGHDPWFMVPGGPRDVYPLNAYGPFFNVLAVPTIWHPLGPKLLFAAAYCFFVAHLLLVVGRRTLPSWVRLAAALWFFSPYPVVELALMGHFDVLVALLAIAAIEARARDRWRASAGWLASAVLLKYYPGVLAPFLALDRGRVRWRYLAASGGLSLAGLGIAWLIWGNSVGRPLWLAVERQSMFLSIFRFLRGPYSPVGHETLVFTTDEYATPLMLFALYQAWQWSRRNEVSPRAACTLAAATTLALYKVGFPQYYMLLFLAAADWFVREYATIRRRLPLAAAYLGLFSWIGWFDQLIVRRDPAPLDDWVGVPTFILMVSLIAATIVETRKAD
ncbi:glycosyltransferase 87 family protein [Paludisphaera rhizosphaerae]|uniref:glycosyltransferase 87 family protein n=1 Tax=Paludisphaera rhizosphaerae TaxID=2711216 RepID=UPI0013EC9DA3|nr:glycosyltransferase 87 family protein [Paludisphaera rhizosphaerae]